MIDKLVLRCQFKDPRSVKNSELNQIDIFDLLEKDDSKQLFQDSPYWQWADFDMTKLGIPLEGSIDPSDNSVSNLRHAWESIPSSYHNLAFKFFFSPNNKICDHPYIEIKASPAYMIQGHNVFGSLDLKECALAIIEPLYLQYPDLVEYLDEKSWEVAQMDLTFASFAPSERDAEQFIHALKGLSRGHTKARSGFATTAYFGQSGTKYKALRIYLKLLEVIEKIKELDKKGNATQRNIYDEKLVDWCRRMIRWEAIIKKRWLERRGYNTNLKNLIDIWSDELAIEFWKEANRDLFKMLSGQEMRIVTDDKVRDKLRACFGKINQRTGKMSYSRADAVYKSYRCMKSDGYEEWHQLTSSSTRSRHLNDLLEIGISQAYLQQFKGDGLAHEVVPMIRYINVDFSAQRPAWAA